MGNKLGWIIAAVLLVLVVVAVVLKITYNPPSSPTTATTRKGFLDKAQMSMTPADITGKTITGTGNAADDYVNAMKIYGENEAEIKLAMDTLADRNFELDTEILTKLNNIARQIAMGTEKKEMHYTFVHTPGELKVEWVYEPVKKLEQIMECLNLLAAYYENHNQYEEAAKMMDMILIMGWQMVNERSKPYVLEGGVSWQKHAIAKLRYFYENIGEKYASRKTPLREYEKQLDSLNAAIVEMKEVFKINDLNKLEAGDIFNIAENDKDRAWRVQAILWLGILKYMYANKSGDMKQIDKLIDEYLDSSDPMEAAAAKAAKNLTKKEYDDI